MARIRRGRQISAAVLALALLAAGCGDDDKASGSTGDASDSSADGAESGGTREVGVVVYSSDDYQVAYQAWLKDMAPEQDIELTICNQELEATKGVDCIDDFITKGVDGIIYAPVDPSAAIAPTEAAIDAGIPIMTVVTRPDGVDTPFMDVNEKDQTIEAGKEAAQQAAELFPDQPVRALVLDLPNLEICADKRMGGFVEGLQAEAPDAEVVRLDGKGDREGALDVTTDALQSGKKFNVVTACTGEMLFGALSALEASGRGKATDKKPETEYVFAIDGNPEQLEALLDPSSPIMSVMGLTPKDNAQKALDLITAMMDGDVAQDDPEVVDMSAALIAADCDAVNSYLTEQFRAEELPCS